MNRLIAALLLLVFPALALADNSLNFAPPPSDYSVVFLGNLFGIVDGVLSGTGSQIMGSMFAVFNAAVLALGGIIIMYTLMVSTMNTAHEGQMLGQKWSSIWIPVRSTLGLALLIPKASGYCLMQIFVMWIVVQGVGAADKIWNAALSYLNRGGVIIQAQQVNPASALLTGSSGIVSIAKGALTILSGQVCMLGLQTQLENQRQTYLDMKANNNGGRCATTPNNPLSPAMSAFCNTAVPDFIGSVNAVTAQTNQQNVVPTPTTFSVQMPNLDTSSPYSFLNGICGTLKWNNISTLANITPLTTTNGVSLSASELSTAQMSRAIAIQQMYVDLTSVAQTIISNSPAMAPPGSSSSSSNSSAYIPNYVNEQFGVPYTQTGTVCQNYNEGCYLWGPASGNGGGTLFTGPEFLNAINDYNGVMMPTLSLMAEMTNATNASNAREFLTQASTQGWIMAGAYFFNLIQIQGSGTNAVTSSTMTDSNTGLDTSIFTASNLVSAFIQNGSTYTCDSGNQFYNLCIWFNSDRTPLKQVETLIDGSAFTNPPLPPPTLTNTAGNPPSLTPGLQASTVYGFVQNSQLLQTANQPGLAPLTFSSTISFSKPDTSALKLAPQSFSCGDVKIIVHICLGQKLGNLFYNTIFLFIYNTFFGIFNSIIESVVNAFLMVPLTGMATIFNQGVQTISTPGVNPIIALANMGAQYINFSGNLWLMLLDMAVVNAVIPWVGIFIFALMALAMPLIFAWVGIMTTIGFTTAYYIPILPYIIFTFGAVSWLIAVIEAMVAAPIVALGVTHPEGHDAFGKGEAAIMILLNVFLRPSMMIIGYIAGIALSYVGVWILNAGFDTAIGFIQQQNTAATTQLFANNSAAASNIPSGSGGYSDWAGIYAFFFSVLAYTTMYLILVQKSFTLISVLPDKVLRWIGGAAESAGQEAGQWAGEVKDQQREPIEKTSSAQGQIDKQLGAYGIKGANKARGIISGGGGGGKITGEDLTTPPGSTPSSPDGSGDTGGGGDTKMQIAKEAGESSA
ncbi:MAG: type IVB secretion system protein DotA [Legionella sp.]|uniref:type IVB secretion system protein DotA n=1 Tax=Legionella sp. TaxID=459 RepID=UPI0039E5C588